MASPVEAPPPRGRRVRSDRCVVTDLTDGWSVAPGSPDCDSVPETGWLPARTPASVADVLREAGVERADLDEQDWWWRRTVDVAPPAPDEELVLQLDGVTPYADVMVDGRTVASVRSMFLPVSIAIPGSVELVIRCRALAPMLARP
ncbi:MAG: beta-mannosidase, partial [Frankiaceae bacterium]|nr:beta-mannosidase [Frankiaceae bacterium]